LFRVKVIEAGSDEWYIVFTLHHLIADDWSIRILVRETGKNYHWLVRGEPNRMPPLPIQYIDYAHWERRNLTAEKCASSLAYWRQHFGPTLPRLRLPTDFRRPTRPKFRGALHNFTLDQALLTRLKQTARSQQCTLFMVLVLAYQWLLSRKSGRADIPVAVPVTSRQRFEVENLIGLFANTLLMYTRVDPEHTVAEALKSVQRIALQAYANQALPFDELVRALRDSRTAVDGVMYDVGFQILDHRNESHDILGFEEGTWEVPRSLPFDLVVDAQIAKCDLFLCAWEVDGRLVCSAEFDVDLFKRSTIVSWMTEYEGLLGFIATDVTRRLREHAVG
jgi:hypothetical protein